MPYGEDASAADWAAHEAARASRNIEELYGRLEKLEELVDWLEGQFMYHMHYVTKLGMTTTPKILTKKEI
jgi:hypothetical protein